MAAELEKPLTGGCNCGAVRFELVRAPHGALACWCGRCRRRTGVGHSLSAGAAPGAFRLLSGERDLGAWAPSDGWEKLFCRSCGSQIAARDPDRPDSLGIRFGAFDEDPGVRPSAHQFTAYAPPWEPVPDDGLPRHSERAPS